MSLKNLQKLFSHSSRLICDSVKRHVSIQNKPVRNNFLLDTIEANSIKSPSDWKSIRQELLNSNEGQYTENNIDSIILGHCINKNQLNLGSLYINFLDNEELKCNLAVTGKYFKLLYLMNEENCFKEGNKLKTDQEILILKKFFQIRKENQVLDSFSLESAISALSLTKEWRTCINLLDEVKITTVPNSHSYSTTAAAAFLNKEENLAWQLLQEMINSNRNINNVVYFAYINSMRKLRKQQNLIFKFEKLFLFLQENNVVIDSSEVPLKLADFGNKLGLPSGITNVNNKGNCKSCNLTLEKFDLTENEFEDLKNKIFEKVIVGKDIFVKTDPRELEKFNEFISENQSFDVVLDGLNIGYSAGTKHSPQVFSALVASVVSYFAKQKKKVLVVGRYHMKKWPKDNWSYIMNNSTVFLTQDISQDDPYLLYCALNSGKDTIIVTRDLMRSHKFLLKTPKLRLLFNRWLSQRQYQLLRVGGTGSPIFRYPPKFTVVAQKNSNTWHIPFREQNGNDPSSIIWLCMQM